MTSDRQTEANRLNAQRSTGPRSAEGKARASQNALKSGIHAKAEIIRGEDPADLDALTAEHFETYLPETANERTQVKLLIRCEWLLDRLARVEAFLWESKLDYALKFNKTSPLGDIFSNNSAAFMRITRQSLSLQRAYKAATLELERLQSRRYAAEAAAAPSSESAETPQPIETKPITSEIGFVPTSQPVDVPAAQTTAAQSAGRPAAPPRIGYFPPKSGNSTLRRR